MQKILFFIVILLRISGFVMTKAEKNNQLINLFKQLNPRKLNNLF